MRTREAVSGWFSSSYASLSFYVLSALVLSFFPRTSLGADADHFESRIRPLFAKHCWTCHTDARMGGLEIVSSRSLLKGGATGPAIIPGDPEQSLLIQAVSHAHPRIKMPPQGKLSSEEILALRRWVAEGAVWPDTAEHSVSSPASDKNFWAFRPVTKPPIPVTENPAWVKTAVDAFVLKTLEERKLEPAPQAEKRVLLRRVYYDLIGLPPTPGEVEHFERDPSASALAKVVDELLASPRYGERWGRYWLDLARYSDDKLNIVTDEVYPNAFRYRDWVIRAFNEDMPYDLFIKAQIAGDHLRVDEKERSRLLPALGFYGMSAQYQEDRPDVTGRVFLGLTVGCAQCHDHKYDPIPTRDYYALLGVFKGTEIYEYPLAAAPIVDDYQNRAKEITAIEKKLQEFRETQARYVAEILARQIVQYLPAVWKVLGPPQLDAAQVAEASQLDQQTLERWIDYLQKDDHEHSHLAEWKRLLVRGGSLAEARKVASDFQNTVLAVHHEMTKIERENLARLGSSEGNPALAKIVLVPYEREKYVFWTSLFGEARTGFTKEREDRVLYYAKDGVDRFLEGMWKEYVRELDGELQQLKDELPAKYSFLHSIKDVEKPENMRVHIRGNPDNLGEEVPRGFLTVLCDGPPKPFVRGSGRLELAEAVANPDNPLTARVMVNRLWQYHFGEGIVRTPSNFGRLGERPTHPELLDYLAAQFVESGWSLKSIHREIVLSATYARSTENVAKNAEIDPDNRLLWRANLRRLDIEALRDSVLAVSGQLDLRSGGPPQELPDERNQRRTVYSFISRRKLDPTLAVFDFPNANDTSARRIVTNTPLQRLFFLNNGLVMTQAEHLSQRVLSSSDDDEQSRIRRAYKLVFGREPSVQEIQWGKQFLEGQEDRWVRYAHALLASNEFQFLN